VPTWKTTEGSTGRLIQLCIAYFAFYVVQGVAVKYFLGHGMKGMELLLYNTGGSTLVVLAVVFGLRWYRLKSNRLITVAGLTFPSEYLYIIPSGVCTAVVVPTTTLMYTLPITVMVAMTIMRGSVIVISRVVDAIQIRQGILKKRVYMVENVAVLFALAAVGVHIYYGATEKGGFDFLNHPAALVIFGSYVTSYAFRIYLMNYFKNTRAKGVALDNKGFFAVEQIAAMVVLFGGTGLILWLVDGNWRVDLMRNAITNPLPDWGWAAITGTAFGFVAFFSVFIFMFKGRTATFAGLVNRLTSLIAGTTATLIFWLGFGGRAPKTQDWISLVFIFIAVGFLSMAERKRAAEIAAEAAREAMLERAASES